MVQALVNEGAVVTVYDPKAMDNARQLPIAGKITFAESPAEAASGAEALIIATEWPEFRHQDFAAIRSGMLAPLVFDGRNLLDPATMREFGLTYHGIGRGV